MTFFRSFVSGALLYGEHVDLRAFVHPGDSIICGGDWSVVEEVRVHRSQPGKPVPTIRKGWDAIEIVTGNGSRWFGYPPRTLPSQPSTSRKPLW